MNSKINDVLNDYTKNLNHFIFDLDLFIDNVLEKSMNIDKESDGLYKIEQIFQREYKEESLIFRSKIEVLIDYLNNIKQIFGGIRYSDILDLLSSNKDLIKTRLKELGLFFMKNNLSKIPQNKELLRAITNEIWLEIISELRNNENYNATVNKSTQFFNKYLEEQANAQIKKALIRYPQLSQDDLNKFKIEFKKSRISIEDYIKSNLKFEKKEEIKTNSQLIIEDEPEQIINVEEVMSEYLNADDRLLARIKRTGKIPDKQTQRRVKKKSEL